MINNRLKLVIFPIILYNVSGDLYMRLKDTFFYTLRENVKDEDSVSGNLLVRSGMVKKTASGIYMFLPLGLKIKQKLENIIREEMEEAGCTTCRCS